MSSRRRQHEAKREANEEYAGRFRRRQKAQRKLERSIRVRRRDAEWCRHNIVRPSTPAVVPEALPDGRRRVVID